MDLNLKGTGFFKALSIIFWFNWGNLIHSNINFLKYDNGIIAMQVNVLIFKKYMMKYLKMKNHDVYTLFRNGSVARDRGNKHKAKLQC